MNKLFILVLRGYGGPIKYAISAPTLAEARRLAKRHADWPGHSFSLRDFEDITDEVLETPQIVTYNDPRD